MKAMGGITKRFLDRDDALRYAEKINASKVIALDEYDERVGDAIWRRDPTEEEIDREGERKIYDRSDI